MSFDFDEVMRGPLERIAQEEEQKRSLERQKLEQQVESEVQRDLFRNFSREGAKRLLAAGIEPDVDVFIARKYKRKWTSKMDTDFEWYGSGWVIQNCSYYQERPNPGIVYLTDGRFTDAHNCSLYRGLPKNSRVLGEATDITFGTVEDAASTVAQLMSRQ